MTVGTYKMSFYRKETAMSVWSRNSPSVYQIQLQPRKYTNPSVEQSLDMWYTVFFRLNTALEGTPPSNERRTFEGSK